MTPLQYDKVDGKFYVGSARGPKADWYRNILVNPAVEIQVTDPRQIADLLEIRLERSPKMVGALFRVEGFPPTPSRAQMEAYAAKRTMVVITPLEDEKAPE